MHLGKEVDAEGRVHVKVNGRVTQANVAHAKIDDRDDPMVQALGEDGFSKQLLVDLSDVDALDSSGVNWLLMIHKRVRQSGGRIVLYALSPNVKHVFRVLNLHTVFELAEDRAKANSLFDGNVS